MNAAQQQGAACRLKKPNDLTNHRTEQTFTCTTCDLHTTLLVLYLCSMNTLAFTVELAQATGQLLLDYYRPAGIAATLKADRTVVTEADLAADELLRDALTETYPDDGVLSEEAETIFPSGKNAVWVIDPLDGTTNFSLGLQHWGVSIARLVDGIPDLGVLCFPLLDELFAASRGNGAFLNNRRLEVSPPTPEQPTRFFSCCSRTVRHYEVSLRYKTRILGSAAYGLATVARGSAILAFEATPKIWDFAASWLIVEEAGGVIAPLTGESPFPLVPGTNYEKRSFSMLAAITPELWAEGRSKIRKKSIQAESR